MKTTWYCRACNDEVEMHFDHVGDCQNVCAGTFSHLPASTCALRLNHLTHQQVFYRRVP